MKVKTPHGGKHRGLWHSKAVQNLISGKAGTTITQSFSEDDVFSQRSGGIM